MRGNKGCTVGLGRVCVGAKHTRTCTIAFLPLQETHYSGKAPQTPLQRPKGGSSRD